MSKVEWIYQDRPVPKTKPKFFGFIYVIEYTDGTLYLGKRHFYQTKIMKPLKSGIQREGGEFFNKIINHKVTQMERVTTENSWREYEGSSKKTKHLTIKKKTMLQIYGNSLNLTYGELEYMIKLDVLRNDMYHNDNILGKFYQKKIFKEIK